MGALRLRPMSVEEVAAFLPRAEEAYYRRLVDFADMGDEEARAKASRDYAGVFPGRRVQEGHFVFAVDEAETGRAVGNVVYALRGGGSKAWLYKLEIDEEARGRGYGREAMRLFEADARARGVYEVGLNVLPGNAIARSLYHSMGYRDHPDERGSMIKRLGDSE